MKIQDAIKQNKSYWDEQLKYNANLRDKHASEAQRYEGLVQDAIKQIALYEKAGEIVDTMTGEGDTGVEEIKVMPK